MLCARCTVTARLPLRKLLLVNCGIESVVDEIALAKWCKEPLATAYRLSTVILHTLHFTCVAAKQRLQRMQSLLYCLCDLSLCYLNREAAMPLWQGKARQGFTNT